MTDDNKDINNINNIWIINLDKSQDRMNHIKKNFDSFDLKYNRFSAIYGKDYTSEKSIHFVCKNFLCNTGMVGCNISHKKIWRQLLDSKEEYYIVFEDDVTIDQKTIDFLKIIPSFLEKYNINYLNLYGVDPFYDLYKPKFYIGNVGIIKPIFPIATTSYIITRKGARFLLDHLSKNYYHVDWEILVLNLFTNFGYYATKPRLVDISEGYKKSTIGNDKHNYSLTMKTLSTLNLFYPKWVLNIPLWTFFLKYEITGLLIFFLTLLLLNLKFFKSKILTGFIILELVIYFLFL